MESIGNGRACQCSGFKVILGIRQAEWLLICLQTHIFHVSKIIVIVKKSPMPIRFSNIAKGPRTRLMKNKLCKQ